MERKVGWQECVLWVFVCSAHHNEHEERGLPGCGSRGLSSVRGIIHGAGGVVFSSTAKPYGEQRKEHTQPCSGGHFSGDRSKKPKRFLTQPLPSRIAHLFAVTPTPPPPASIITANGMMFVTLPDLLLTDLQTLKTLFNPKKQKTTKTLDDL